MFVENFCEVKSRLGNFTVLVKVIFPTYMMHFGLECPSMELHQTYSVNTNRPLKKWTQRQEQVKALN